MQDDVTDGVKAMIDQHLADPHRVCILGGSYGGYAALAGRRVHPPICIPARSVSTECFDLPLMQVYEERHSGELSDTALYWREHIGSPAGSQSRGCLTQSPSKPRGGPKCCSFMPWTIQWFLQNSPTSWRKLCGAGGKSITLLKIPGDDHWLSGAETRVKVLKAHRYLSSGRIYRIEFMSALIYVFVTSLQQ